MARVLIIDDDFEVLDVLRDVVSDIGHEVEAAGPWSLGRNCAALKRGTRLAAAATPRRAQAYAVGR